MKIKDKDLRESYQSFLRIKKTDGIECPQIEILINTLSKESNENEKFKIIDHISECSDCFKTFEAIKPFFLDGEKIKKELEEISLSEQEVKELQQRAKEKVFELKRDRKKKRRVSIFPRVRLAYLSVAAIMLIVVLGAVLIFKGPDDSLKNIVRGTENKMMKLVNPVGLLRKPPIVFEWTMYPEAKEYQVKLLDAQLTQIWMSGKTEETKVDFPPDLYKTIKENRIYYWKVIVFMEGRIIKEFGLQEFKIQQD